MAFAFESGDRAVEAGFRRIALEQLGGALEDLAGAGGDTAEAVHGVRKRCKRLRGLLRLVRRSFKPYAKENAAIRDAAAVLSPLRDETMLDATAAKIEAKLAPETAARLRAALADRAARLRAAEDEALTLLRCHAGLARVRDRAGAWRLKSGRSGGSGFNALGENFLETYREARRGMRHAAKSASAEDFHAWRKQVKYHFHHLDLLGEAAPHLLKGHRKLADDLAETIGEHHDAAVFLAVIAAEPESFGELGGAAPIEDALRTRQDELAGRAAVLGRELLGEKPARFTERVGRYWADWREDGA